MMGFGLRASGAGLFLFSVGAVGCHQPAQPPASPPVVTVAAEIVKNLVLVPVSVNGSTPAPFILDTGSSSSVINQRPVDAAAIRKVTLELGGITLPAVNTVAIDLIGVEAGLGQHVAGILGSEIFKQRVVEIDYAKQVVRFHDPPSFHYAGAARPVPMLFRVDIPLVRPIFVTPEGDELDAKLELKTGQSDALTLIRPFVVGAQLMDPSQVPAQVMRLKSIRLGETSFANVVTNVAPTAAAAGVSGETMGLIGGELLRRFRVFVDYSRSQLFLEPNGAPR